MDSRFIRRNRNLICVYLSFTAIITVLLWTAMSHAPSADNASGPSVAHENPERKRIINDFVFKRNNFSTRNELAEWKKSRVHHSARPHGIPYTVQRPTLVWWAPVSGTKDHGITCDGIQCDVSMKRGIKNSPDVRAFIFYGTLFSVDQLPLPRLPHHIWALEHDESPKNNEFLFSHEESMSLFNFTSTFKRESSYPISTMFLPGLDWLQSRTYVLSFEQKSDLQRTKGLAPVVFVHTDCRVPSDRNTYLALLQAYVKVDVYGKCNSNKNLPENIQGMHRLQSKDFYRFLAQYKFAFAFENSVCDDYMTEKLWRPLHLGVIPIVFGSPKDFLPNNISALVVEDFTGVERLAEAIKDISENVYMYDHFLTFKDKDGITNEHLIQVLKDRDWSFNGEGPRSKKYGSHFDGYECFLCKKVHENIIREVERKPPLVSIATKSHYGCPRPQSFNDVGEYVDKNRGYDEVYTDSQYFAKAFRHFYDTRNVTYTERDVRTLAKELRRKDEKTP